VVSFDALCKSQSRAYLRTVISMFLAVLPRREFALACALLSLQVCAAEVSVELPLRIEAKVETSGVSGARIAFTLTNVTDKPIRLRDLDLPWQLRGNTFVLATTAKLRRVLRSAPFVPRHPFDAKTIGLAPNESLRGEMLLSDHVDYDALKREKEKLVIFWHTSMVDSAGESLGDYGGWMALEGGSVRRTPR